MYSTVGTVSGLGRKEEQERYMVRFYMILGPTITASLNDGAQPNVTG